jgi:hypothetical protein
VLRGAVLPAGFWRSLSSPGAVLALDWPLALVLPLVLPLVFLWSAAQPARVSPNSAIQSSLLMKGLRKKVALDRRKVHS